MGLKGVSKASSPTENTSFRTSWTQPEGSTAAHVYECRVFDVNLASWTVDCRAVFDRKKFFDVQVSSPYLHWHSGEGMSIMPDIGAKCQVCFPSDGSPPFVLTFIMPVEKILGSPNSDTGEPEVQGSAYSGGRTNAKPGDMAIRGRDGNFVVWHRGGVLQIGASELAQRIYIPLGNLITDISQNYTHFNTGGSINWGVRDGVSEKKDETEYKHVFRVYAGDEFADVRVSIGKVQVPVPEPQGGSQEDLAALDIGVNSPIVVEAVVAPGGFDAATGQPKDATDKTVIRMFFDRAGGAMLRAEGSVSLRTKKTFRLRADEGIELFTKNLSIEATESASIRGGKSFEIGTDGGVLKLNGGSKPIATVGSMVKIIVAVPIQIMTGPPPGVPGVISAGAVFFGTVSSGNPTLLG